MEYVAITKMDTQSLLSMREVFKLLAEADEDITIDMNAVNFIDGAGIGALVYVLKRVRAKRRVFKIINLRGQPRQLFEELRLNFF
jgi:anti-anti-sigma factor